MNQVGAESTGQPSAAATAGTETSFVETPAAAEPAADLNAGGEPSVDDFAELASPESSDDSDGQPAKEPAAAPAPAAPAAPAPAAQPAAAAPAQPAVSAQPAAATPPAAAPAAAAQPAAQPAPAAPKQETAEEKVARETAAREADAQMTTQLETYYAIPEELASQLQTEPELALPKLAAKVHLAVLKGVQQYMATQLPGYIQQSQEVTQRESASKKAFFDANPDLAGYEQQVLQAGRLFREMNPTAAPELAIKQIGNIVRSSLGLTAAPAPNAGAVQAAPAAPAQAFRPAGSGATGGGNPPSAGVNEFETLAMED